MTERSVPRDSIAAEGKGIPIFRELNTDHSPRSCAELLAELQTPPVVDSRELVFDNVGARDVYNITAPFSLNGKTLLAGRVERRETEFSEIVFFEQTTNGHWTACFTHPDFVGLQDPCITRAGNDLLLGGVRYPVSMDNGELRYRMDFYRGPSLESLKFAFSGPIGMKDIRFKQLRNGRVAVFSRPQGAIGGRGQIGFALCDSWDAINAELIGSAPVFDGQLLKDEWGGVNEVHLLANGYLGVLGHIACFDSRHHRHYYPMVFMVDPTSRRRTPIRIIARRSYFPNGVAKRPDLVDVVFSGGMVRNGGGTAQLYAGISDVAAAVVELPDPFIQYEN